MQILLVVGLAGLAVVSGCKSESGGGVASPVQPMATAEQDALWKLAPEGAIAGFVASPRGVELVERAVLAGRALLATAPELAPLAQKLEAALRDATGTPSPTLADLGLTHDKSLAWFMARDGRFVLVLPVADRDRFLAKVHGKRGADVDELDGGVCKTIDGRYVCVQNRALLAGLGAAALDTTRTAAGARGELEFAGHDFTGPHGPSVAVAAQLVPGAITVRGTVGGVPSSVTTMLGAPVRPRPESAGSSGFGVIDLTPYLALVPAVPVMRGITLDRLARSVAGPLTLAVAPGTTDLGIRIPLNDPAPAKTLVEHCTELPALAVAGATVKDGACQFTVPQIGIQVAAWIEGKELRIGQRTGAASAALVPSPLAAELSRSEWSVAFSSRGTYLAIADLPGATDMLKSATDDAAMIARALPLLNELGFGLRKQGDALHFVLGVRTAWANPDDVVRKLLAVSSADLLSGRASRTSQAIAAAAPGSPFAQDLRAGTGGLICLAMPVGILAGVAVPAFMDYMKRSKQTEAPAKAD